MTSLRKRWTSSSKSFVPSRRLILYKQFFGFMTASFLAASPYSVLFSRHVIHAGVELPPNSAGTTSGAVWAAENVATQHSPARHERCVRGADEGGMPQPHVASTAGCRFSTCDAAACALATGHARVPVPKSMPSPGPSLFMATSCVCVCVCVRARGSSVLRRACGPRTRAAHACAPGTPSQAAPALSRPGRAPASPPAASRTSRGSPRVAAPACGGTSKRRRRSAFAAPGTAAPGSSQPLLLEDGWDGWVKRADAMAPTECGGAEDRMVRADRARLAGLAAYKADDLKSAQVSGCSARVQ